MLMPFHSQIDTSTMAEVPGPAFVPPPASQLRPIYGQPVTPMVEHTQQSVDASGRPRTSKCSWVIDDDSGQKSLMKVFYVRILPKDTNIPIIS